MNEVFPYNARKLYLIQMHSLATRCRYSGNLLCGIKMVEVREEKVSISFGTKVLDGIFTLPEMKCVQTALILTHGAGGDMNVKSLRSLAKAAATSGLLCLRFTCKGLNLVHRVRAYDAVMEYLKTHKNFMLSNIFLGGRSMGARAAVALCRQLCTKEEDAVRGVLCISFPLHPPGQTHAHLKRSEDLKALTNIPVLFVSGTADNMCEQKLLEKVKDQMGSMTSLHWVEGANHGLALKGRTEESVLDEVNSKIIMWILQHV